MSLDLEFIARAAGARKARRGERIQTLWAGYGELVRVELDSAAADSVVVKHVSPPARGGSDLGDRRKRRSYDVETAWYRNFAARCGDACRVPRLVDSRVSRNEWLLVLEDLDAAGYGERRRLGSHTEIDACLAWLAAFHATFLGTAPNGLWSVGTYWHLATRPDELAAIDDGALREAAPVLDRMLRAARFQTLVHGDAKLANFCFARDGSVAAVDFQYVGGGCGMKDVAYLICGEGADVERRHLDVYFRHLRAAAPDHDVDAIEQEWRALYPIACVDFYRFLAGWAKSHYARDASAHRLTREVLAGLDHSAR